MEQKFHKGDWVRVSKDLGRSMSHFKADRDAIVIGSYADQYGGRNHTSYTIHIEGRGETSWYYESQLTLIEPGRIDKLEQWEVERDAKAKQRADLDWIFSNADEAMRGHGATVEALGKCLGMDNLWGSRGEGFAYMTNAMRIMAVAEPFIRSGDKAGWLALCTKYAVVKS